MESGAEQDGALNGTDIGLALHTPPAEVVFDLGVDDPVYLFEEIFGREDSRSQSVASEYAVLVYIATDELGKPLSDDGAMIVEPFGSAIGIIDGNAQCMQDATDDRLPASYSAGDPNGNHCLCLLNPFDDELYLRGGDLVVPEPVGFHDQLYGQRGVAME